MSLHNTENLTITEVVVGPKGTGKRGAWQIYNLTFDGSDKKFTWFQTDSIVPQVGTKIPTMKYEIKTNEKDGKEYKNFTIKKIEFDNVSQLKNTPPKGKVPTSIPASNVTMFISYAKDLLVSICAGGGYKEVDYPELVKMYTQEGMRSYYDTVEMLKMDAAMESTKESETRSEEEPTGEEPPPSNDIPF